MNIRNALTVVSLAMILAACSGGGGGDSAAGVEPGPPPPSGPVPPDPPVQPTDSIAADAINESDSVETQLTAVTFNSPLTVTFSLIVNDSQRVTGLSSGTARFSLARLEQAANGEHENWVSYVERQEDPVCRDQDDVDDNDCTTFTTETDPALVPDSALVVQDPVAIGKQVLDQATAERNGTYTDNEDGSWSYTFLEDPGDPASLPQVHRVCIQFSLDADVINPCIDFIPSELASLGDAATSLQPSFYDDNLTRQVVTEASCNTCHAKLAIHGGGRTATDYCVTCHNPGSIDANSDNTVDLKVMAHRIHYATELASVNAGIPYKIWGFRNSEHDYSHVSYPQNVLNCTRCHAGQEDVDWMAMEGLPAPEAMLTTDGHNWASKPNAEACGSCHEDAADHIAEKLAEDGGCVDCHGDNEFASVRVKHRNLIEETAARFEPRILAISNTGPGEFPQVRFSIVDPGNGDAPYDLENDAAWTQGGGASRLAIDLAWSTTDYTNTGNDPVEPVDASAVSIDGLTASPLGNGEYLATSTVAIPDGTLAPNIAATGSGAVGIEGHPAVDFGEEGEPDVERIPMDNVVDYFSIDESSGDANARRDIIDMDQCLACHRSLNLHGNNRSNEEQVCAMCHNPRNTDREVREVAATPPTDGKDEESLDFKTMVHAIHASGMRENPLQIVGFRGFSTHVYDEEHIQYPGDLSNCEACHDGDTYALPLASSVLAPTVDTGADHGSPEDDLVITPTAAVCSSCHDSDSARSHMTTTGGALFDAPLAEAEAAVESCDVCHGNDSSSGVNLVHPGLR